MESIGKYQIVRELGKGATGKVYLGAFVNAMLVTWMFVSSQVIAPLPI